ncbi:MAG: alpha-hydroxy-acid oxidizing protein [Candidatus Thorarchaeota archaeon]|jgi:isopentenyl diphosphate isomerase/L-lactate dehydrogenase-like FMN-dependent dehydrogenase/rubredoxin
MLYFICTYCNAYVYDEEAGDLDSGLAPGTKISEISDAWRCPICDQPRDYMQETSEETFSEKKTRIKKRRDGPEPEKKDLTYYRAIAREMLAGLCGVHPVCDGAGDRVCAGQKYGKPLGVGGAGQGNTFRANYLALHRYKLKQRVVKEHYEPEMDTEIFGKKIIAPVLGCSMSGVKASMNNAIPEADFYRGLLEGAQKFGTIGLVGNTAAVPDHLGIDMVKENNGWGIAVFKPQSQERLLELFKMAEEYNAIAIGVDLDGCGSAIWAAKGKPVYSKNPRELKELVDSTGKPVFFKGIMTVEDALAVADSGAAGVYLSNHGGRVLDNGQGVVEILPDVVTELKGKLAIMVDGAIRTGYDVLKVIALGADTAHIGRPLLRMSLAGGADAVSMYFNYVKGDLRRAMIMTGCRTLKDATTDILT